jgi:hypothetical protein
MLLCLTCTVEVLLVLQYASPTTECRRSEGPSGSASRGDKGCNSLDKPARQWGGYFYLTSLLECKMHGLLRSTVEEENDETQYPSRGNFAFDYCCWS